MSLPVRLGVLVFASLPALAAGCTVGELDPDRDDSEEEIAEPTSDAVLLPELGYGGYDGIHSFQIPMATNLAEATWQVVGGQGSIEQRAVPADAIDTPLVSWALLTTGSGGTVEVAATGGDKRGVSRFHITTYTPTEIERGARRYLTPDDPTGPGRASCASCHARPDGHDHSAVNTMFWSDENLIRAITTGAYTDDTSLTVAHDWNVTPDEARGLVGYLRALPPRGF